MGKWIIAFVLLTSTSLYAQNVPTTQDTGQEPVKSEPPQLENTKQELHERAKEELKEEERQRSMTGRHEAKRKTIPLPDL